MADLGKGTPEERLLALEKWARNVTRSRTGFSALPGKNTIGQDTNVTGDMTITGILTAAGISTVDISVHDHETDAQGGQLDHGAALTGLLDDDHPQYLDTFRHDTTARHTLGTVVPVVSILAGDGLAGGGELTVNRTLSVDESAAFDWTGTHVFNNTVGVKNTLTARSIIPEATDTYDIGSSTMLWRKGWLSELDTVLFAQNTQVLLGGWFVISKGEGVLPTDLASGATTYDFGQAMTVSDFLEFRSSLAVEYMQVGSLVSGTTYNISRNLDGSGANDWPAGIAYRINGQSGNGRIELNAKDSPRISIIKQGATYAGQTEEARFGDLNGGWGYTAETYGIALGQYTSGIGNMTYDSTNGLRIRLYGTTVMQFNSGVSKITGVLNMPDTTSAIAIGSTPPTSASAGTGLWIDRTGLYSLAGGTPQVKINAITGELYAGNNLIKLDVNGINIVSGEGLGSAVTWYTAYEGPSVSRINSVAAGSSYDQAWLSLRSSGFMNDAQTGVIYLAAILGDNVDATPRTTLKLSYSGGAEIDTTSGGTPRLRVASYVDIGEGLYIGNYSGGNPGTGVIKATSYANIGSGLYVGNVNGGNPGVGSIVATGYIVGSIGVSGILRRRSSNLAVSASGNTTVTYTSQEQDTYGNMIVDLNGYIYARTAGFYLITGHVQFDAVGNVSYWRGLFINTSTSSGVIAQSGGQGYISQDLTVAGMVWMNSGDYAYLGVYESSGGKNVVNADFTMIRIA